MQDLTRRSLLRLAGGTVVGLSATGIAGCGKETNTSGRETNTSADGFYSGGLPVFGYESDLSTAPLHIAKNEGFFGQAGLTLKPTQFGNPADSARAAASNMPTGVLSAVGALAAFDAGLRDLRILGTALVRSEFVFLVKPDSPVTSFADLRGKKVGVSIPGSVTYSLAATAARQAGLDPAKDLSLIDVKLDYTNALLEGVVDAAWNTPPISTQLVKEGKARLLLDTSTIAPKFVSVVYATSAAFVSDKSDVLRRWTAALNKANAMIAGKTDAAAASWAKTARVDPTAARDALTNYSQDFRMIDAVGMEAMVRFAMDVGLVKDSHILSKIMAPSNLLPGDAR